MSAQRRHALRQFNMSVADYDEMFEAQDGDCALCGRPETRKNPKTGEVLRLAVDHCHVTGRVRGLLCCNCNTGLGKLGDTPEALEKALAYVRGDDFYDE